MSDIPDYMISDTIIIDTDTGEIVEDFDFSEVPYISELMSVILNVEE